MDSTKKKDFFVSYNKADHEWAVWIAWQLEEAGCSAVIQAWDFRPGSNFVLEMNNASQVAVRTIAVLSPNYLDAKFPQPEWAAALAQDPTGSLGKLLPIRVRECTLDGLLQQIVFIDLVGKDEHEAKAALLGGILRDRAKPSTPPTFPGPKVHSVEKPMFFPGAPIAENQDHGMGDSEEARPFRYGFDLPGKKDLDCDRYEQWGKLDSLARTRESEIILVPGPLRHGHNYFLLRIKTGLRRDPPRDVMTLRTQQKTLPGWLGQLGSALGCDGSHDAVVRALGQRLQRKNLVLLFPLLDRCDDNDVLEQHPLRVFLHSGLPKLLASVNDGARTPFGLKCIQPLAWVPSPHLKELAARLYLLVPHRSEPAWVNQALSRRRMNHLANLLAEGAHIRMPVHRLSDLTGITEAHVLDFCNQVRLREQKRKDFVKDVFYGTGHPDDVLRSIIDYLPRYKEEDGDE